MKKFLMPILVIGIVFLSTSCTWQKDNEIENMESDVYNVGMLFRGSENSSQNENLLMAMENAKALLLDKGININWDFNYNDDEDEDVALDCTDFGETGCIAVFCSSRDMEKAMLKVAPDYPETVFSCMGGERAWQDDFDNTVNAFPPVHEGRYLAGAIAGYKLNDMIEKGDIKKKEALIGYVGANKSSEVISGYTAFYLGAKSVCPSAKMKVEFINSWGDSELEEKTTQHLIDKGAVLISEHTDTITPAIVSEENGVCHIGYNISMSDIAPKTSLISTRIDWTNYIVSLIESIVEGETIEQDYYGYGIEDGEVRITSLNTNVAPEGAEEFIENIEARILGGSVEVFDIEKFAINGKKMQSAFAIDSDGDLKRDKEEAVFDGAFHESYFQSAPYFEYKVDGIK